ncbi:MAG: hypothetical protein ACI9YU_001374 [Flavobacteriales bacterium]|jgi:hypothetical protein
MRNWGSRFLKVGTVFLVALLLLELSYRFYIIEFYSTELQALNESLPPSKKDLANILFLGDSFTAHTESYVTKLRVDVPFKLINSAISGTGILEASFMTHTRLIEFEPTSVVYQIYLGNDLLDIRHRPTDRMSSIRRIYHIVSDRIRVIKFLNYRLGQTVVNDDHDNRSLPSGSENEVFSMDSYSPRQKRLFKEEPLILENVLELKNGREEDFAILVSRLHKIEKQLNDSCQLIIVLIPHCAQVNDTYNSRMKLLGSNSKELSSNKFYSGFEKEFADHTLINALPAFQRLDKPTDRIYRENDPHLSDFGQTVLANLLMPHLTNELKE